MPLRTTTPHCMEKSFNRLFLNKTVIKDSLLNLLSFTGPWQEWQGNDSWLYLSCSLASQMQIYQTKISKHLPFREEKLFYILLQVSIRHSSRGPILSHSAWVSELPLSLGRVNTLAGLPGHRYDKASFQQELSGFHNKPKWTITRKGYLCERQQSSALCHDLN